jgi:hypothetical protein
MPKKMAVMGCTAEKMVVLPASGAPTSRKVFPRHPDFRRINDVKTAADNVNMSDGDSES